MNKKSSTLTLRLTAEETAILEHLKPFHRKRLDKVPRKIFLKDICYQKP